MAHVDATMRMIETQQFSQQIFEQEILPDKNLGLFYAHLSRHLARLLFTRNDALYL